MITNSQANDLDLADEATLSFDIPDEVIEAAARVRTGAALSFPAAPTVSILVVCCSND